MCCGGVVLVLLHKYYCSISLGLAKDKGESKLERESWMIELPANKKTFGMLIYSLVLPTFKHVWEGLGPRKFREAAFEPGDQSVWTDTPADREKKSEVWMCT